MYTLVVPGVEKYEAMLVHIVLHASMNILKYILGLLHHSIFVHTFSRTFPISKEDYTNVFETGLTSSPLKLRS